MTYISFNLPHLNFKCSLNEIGRPKYGTLEQLIDTEFKNCQVGTNEGYKNLPNFRVGKFKKTRLKVENSIELNNLITIKIIEMIPGYSIYDLDFDIDGKYKILKYKENDFFNKHRDKVYNNRHFGTLLFFPPSINNFKHTGGELILNDNFEFKSSTNEEWKCIVFTNDTIHEVKKILSGNRIVLKTELYYRMNYSLNYNIFPDHTD